MTANVTEPEATPDNTEVVDADGSLQQSNGTEEEENVLGSGIEESGGTDDSVNTDVNVEEGETLLGGDTGEQQSLAPESYESFYIPDGVDVAEEELEAFQAQAKELDLTQTQAQKLLESQLKVRETQQASYEQSKYQQQQEWVDELKNDAVFGGKNLGETVERANRTLRTFGDEEITGLLKSTGYGNNPAIIRMFAKIDKRLGEDKSVDGQPGVVGEKDPYDEMFDHPTSQI